MVNEYKLLKEGTGKLNIPTPFELDKNNNVIITDYIIGENLCDIINDEKITYNEKKRLVTLLSDWFLDFHNFFKKENQFKIRGDPILRNFIFTDRIWGVDFEESRPGKVVEDIAGMCASILSTDPMFTKEKYQLCRVFIDNYIEKAPGRIISINDEISYSLLQKIQYRPDDKEILRKHSKKIRQNGITI
jgi:hypothetical protein